VRDIELTDEQRADLSRRSGMGRLKGSRTNAARALARHHDARRAGREAARQGDVLHAAANLFADHAEIEREIESFWLRGLGLPTTCLRKSAVNRYSKHSKKKRRNKLPYGTCRLTIADTRLVHEIHGAIQEYGGFEREGWPM
jgi:hypothetical protein